MTAEQYRRQAEHFLRFNPASVPDAPEKARTYALLALSAAISEHGDSGGRFEFEDCAPHARG